MTNLSLIELHQQGRHEEVLKLDRTIEVRAADDPQSTLIVAASLFNLKRYGDSLKILSALEPLIHTDDTYLNLLGMCLWRIGELDKAEHVFEFAHAQHKDHLAIARAYINLLFERQKYSQAGQVLAQALQQNAHAPELQELRLRLDQLQASPRVAPAGDSKGMPFTLPQARATPVALLSGSEAHSDSPTISSGSLKPLLSESPQVAGGASPSTELVSLPKTTETQDDKPEIGAAQDLPALQPTTIDPLLLAFSQEEVAFDRDNRRRQRDSRNQDSNAPSPLLDGSQSVVEVLPVLPEPPLQEVSEELITVIQAALAEKQYECALAVADHLRRLDPTRQTQLYRLCSEAYAGLGNLATSELCLQTLAVHGELEDFDRLNLAGMALRRYDLNLAEYYLSELRNPELHRDILLAHQEKLRQRQAEQQPALVFSTKGLKAVRVKPKQVQHPDLARVSNPAADESQHSEASHPSNQNPQADPVQPIASQGRTVSQPSSKRAARSRNPANSRKTRPSQKVEKP